MFEILKITLPLALPELPDRQANGLTGIAIFILRYTADPVRHRH